MSKKKVVSICFAVMIVSVTGIALAMALKVALTPYDAPPEWRMPGASGHALLQYTSEDKTEVEVNCNGLYTAFRIIRCNIIECPFFTIVPACTV